MHQFGNETSRSSERAATGTPPGAGNADEIDLESLWADVSTRGRRLLKSTKSLARIKLVRAKLRSRRFVRQLILSAAGGALVLASAIVAIVLTLWGLAGLIASVMTAPLWQGALITGLGVLASIAIVGWLAARHLAERTLDALEAEFPVESAAVAAAPREVRS